MYTAGSSLILVSPTIPRGHMELFDQIRRRKAGEAGQRAGQPLYYDHTTPFLTCYARHTRLLFFTPRHNTSCLQLELLGAPGREDEGADGAFDAAHQKLE